ncbi:hypothetical protein [Burkholderia sp. IDO3]|uniref:hypothetical protein n=1 Tax=Burkholderia sp. IDO3 TaxID=1705310 RepID=UPI001F0802F8|nr:hypothetical protein [Burkholderia sp. IDO3]
MSNKRRRLSGAREYTIKRTKLLPRLLSLTFDTEEEGDAYVARLEQLLDAGIVPEEVVQQHDSLATTGDAIRAYLRRVSVPASDVHVDALLGREATKAKALSTLDYRWVEHVLRHHS